MKAEVITKEKNLTTVQMAFSVEEFESAVKDVYTKTKSRYAVDGFRKGKAPQKLIERKYGEGVFFEDAINNLLGKEYPNMLDDLDIKPVDRPEIDFQAVKVGEPFVVTVKITVEPEVQVTNYKGIEVEKITYSVTDEDVQKELEMLQKRNSRMVVVERAAQKGDTVLIDYEGFAGDEAFEGGTAKKQPLTLGSGTFIPGFEDQLVGAKAGDKIDVKVTFPAEYHAEDLAGQDAVFKVTLHEVRQSELPELDDEFAKDVSEFDTLDEYKADIKAKIEKEAQAKAEYEQRNAMLDVLYDNTEVDIPPVMIEEEVEDLLEEVKQQVRYQGMDMDAYLKYSGKDMASLKEGLRPDALKRVKIQMILEAVAKAENIVATQEEVDKELEAMAEMYKMDIEKIKTDLGTGNFGRLEQDIRLRKAVDLIADHAKIVEAVKPEAAKAELAEDKTEEK